MYKATIYYNILLYWLLISNAIRYCYGLKFKHHQIKNSSRKKSRRNARKDVRIKLPNKVIELLWKLKKDIVFWHFFVYLFTSTNPISSLMLLKVVSLITPYYLRYHYYNLFHYKYISIIIYKNQLLLKTD